METTAQSSDTSSYMRAMQRDQVIGRIRIIMEQFATRSVADQHAENLATEGLTLLMCHNFSSTDVQSFLNHARLCVNSDRLLELSQSVKAEVAGHILSR
jgi:hypothetical protein